MPWEGAAALVVALGTLVGSVIAARRSASKEVVESLEAAFERIRRENEECQKRCAMLMKRVVALERKLYAPKKGPE